MSKFLILAHIYQFSQGAKYLFILVCYLRGEWTKLKFSVQTKYLIGADAALAPIRLAALIADQTPDH